MTKTKAENVGVDGGSKSKNKTSKSNGIGFKARPVHTTLEVMVKEALKEMQRSEGVSLSAIRNYISRHYNNGRRLGKVRQQLIKDFISMQFDGGKIVMVNNEKKNINFTKRFSLVGETNEL